MRPTRLFRVLLKLIPILRGHHMPRGAGHGSGGRGIYKMVDSWLRWSVKHGGRRQHGPLSTRTWRPKSPFFGKRATFGHTNSTDYKENFFRRHPELRGKVWVHHAVEQQARTRWPRALTPSQLHSYENLRGIPKDVNSRVHLSEIRKDWNEFYRNNPNPSQADLLAHASKIDDKFGHLFVPRMR